jgi:cell division protein FtsB
MSRRPTTRTKSADTPAQRPHVPTTSFNFIDDLWMLRVKTRRRTVLVAVASVVVIAATAWYGSSLSSRTADLTAQEQTLTARASELERAIADETQGFTNLPEHVAARTAEVTAITSADVDIEELVALLAAATPQSVTVRSVTVTEQLSAPPVTDPATSTAPADPTALNPDPLAPLPTEPPTATPATPPADVPVTAPARTYLVTVDAAGKTWDDPLQWRNALRAESAFASVDVQRVGSPDAGLTITASFTVAADAVDNRSQAILDAAGLSGGS